MAQQLEQGIDEVSTCVGFIIRDTLVLLQVFLEAVDQLDQFVRQILHEASLFSIVHKTRDMQPGTDLRASQPSCRLAKTSPTRYACSGGYDVHCDAALIRRADGSGDRVPVHHQVKERGQEMDTNKQLQKRPWIIAGLVMLTLLSTDMTGCRDQATSGTVNSTFVDVNGLLTVPTKIVASYATENLNLGNDSCAGIPQFLDGTLYTFSYHDDLTQWTTAWDQATGKKLWSVPTNADTSISPNATFTTDGKYLFFIRQEVFTSQGLPDSTEPVSYTHLTLP